MIFSSKFVEFVLIQVNLSYRVNLSTYPFNFGITQVPTLKQCLYFHVFINNIFFQHLRVFIDNSETSDIQKFFDNYYSHVYTIVNEQFAHTEQNLRLKGVHKVRFGYLDNLQSLVEVTWMPPFLGEHIFDKLLFFSQLYFLFITFYLIILYLSIIQYISDMYLFISIIYFLVKSISL